MKTVWKHLKMTKNMDEIYLEQLFHLLLSRVLISMTRYKWFYVKLKLVNTFFVLFFVIFSNFGNFYLLVYLIVNSTSE